MRNSLRLRLTLIFIGLATLPLIIVGVGLAYYNFTVISQEAVNLQSEVAQRVGKEVANLIGTRENELTVLARVRSIAQADPEERISLLTGLLASQDVYEELTVLNSEGQEITRVGSLKIFPDEELKNRASSPEFEEPMRSGHVYYSPVQFNDETGEPFMVVGVPSYDLRSGEFTGVLVANLRFKSIWDLMGTAQVPGSGIVYVLDAENRVVAHRDPAIVLQGTQLELPAEGGYYPGLENDNAAIAFSVNRFGDQEFRTVAEREANESLAIAVSNFYLTVVAIVISLLVAAIISVVVARRVVGPIETLAVTSEAIAGGDLTQVVAVRSRDEIGRLAESFNRMTNQLKLLIEGLELRVVERTRALTASVEVSRSLSTVLDPDQLVVEVVEQVRAAFEYYYVQIYLTDTQTSQLQMVGGTGEAGQILLARGHTLAAGQGLVGRAAATNSPVFIPDVSQAPDWKANALLPDTKAEVAVPIAVGDLVLGVLDVQHDVSNGLVEDDVQVLQSVAYQVAIAIQNARTYDQVRKRADREIAINAINRKIQTAISVDEVMKIAARELALTLGNPQTSVQLRNPALRVNGNDDSDRHSNY